MASQNSEEYLNPEEAGALLGISRRTLERYANAGRIRIIFTRSENEATFARVCLGVNALLVAGSDAQKRELLPAIAEGRSLATLAAFEPDKNWTAAGIEAEPVFKVNEGRPNIVDLVKTGKIDLVINTPLGRESFYDEKSIRRAAIRYNIPCITTLAAAHAAALGIRALVEQTTEVAALQDLHQRKVAASDGAGD